MPTYLFRKTSAAAHEAATPYDADDQAIEDALANLQGVVKVVLSDGKIVDRPELERLAAAARDPQ